MSELTGIEIWKRRDALEQGVATLLGRMLFEFSRLDVNLGLCVVWTDGGKRLKELTPQVAEFTFHKKLDFLGEFVKAALPKGSKGQTAYIDWIQRAHASRVKRNQLVHGRWAVEPGWNYVANVVGLPTSSEQIESRYTLVDLESVLEELKQLQKRLSDLRERWPL
jgi:hypothetical protein